MCHYYRYRGIGLIVLGVIIGVSGAIHHFGYGCRREQFEQHVAEICVKAAEQVHK